MLRDILKPYLVEWPMSDDLDPRAYEINRLIGQLDDAAVGYEAKWGVGYLEAHAPAEMQERWQRQVEKLNGAIEALDVALVRQLVEGCVRGYAALEAAVEASHGPPSGPVFWEYKCGSMIYRVVKGSADARALHNPGEANVVILSAQEMCERFEMDRQRVFRPRPAEAKKAAETHFDFDKGDDVI